MGPIFCFSIGHTIVLFLVFLRIFHITLYNAIDFTQEKKDVSHYLLKGNVSYKSRKIQDPHPWCAPC